MKVLDLFSGIGGFSLGLERAGMETVAFCEYDEKCRKVLTKHWPEVPQYNDVRTLTAEQLENDGITDIGLICGGYPCQPFSTAGKREGKDDDRHLWPELFRLVQEIRPTWVLCENVAGHISMGLDSVLADLESENYQCQTLLIPACAVGASHRRDRLWIIANTNGEHGAECAQEQIFRQPDLQVKLRGSIEAITRKPSEVEAFLSREDDGIPGRVDRLKQLGNSVVPQVVEVIGRAILKAEDQYD